MIVDVSGQDHAGRRRRRDAEGQDASLIQQGKKKVLLNLGDVSYVDSAGLGEIVQAYATVNKNGGKLKLLNVTKRIKDLLSITKLLTVFECHDNEAEAVKSFKQRRRRLWRRCRSSPPIGRRQHAHRWIRRASVDRSPSHSLVGRLRCIQPHRLHKGTVARRIPHREPHPRLAGRVEWNREVLAAEGAEVGR